MSCPPARTQRHLAPEADFYLVYLSGIGAISGTSVPAEEYPFIDGLRKRLPKAKIISDIYPYSVTNNGLTGQRGFSWLWRGLEKIGQTPGSKLAIMTMVINLRNAFQLFVSADRRYGPVYNLGIANEVYGGLLRHGMHPRSSKPVIMLGWSGGGQIAIGSVEYLAGLPGPIYVISIGGMLSDDPGPQEGRPPLASLRRSRPAPGPRQRLLRRTLADHAPIALEHGHGRRPYRHDLPGPVRPQRQGQLLRHGDARHQRQEGPHARSEDARHHRAHSQRGRAGQRRRRRRRLEDERALGNRRRAGSDRPAHGGGGQRERGQGSEKGAEPTAPTPTPPEVA